MITCRQICNHATDALEGPTTPVQRFLLRFHLLICKHCRRYYEQFRITIGVASLVLGEELREPTDQEIDALVERLKNR